MASIKTDLHTIVNKYQEIIRRSMPLRRSSRNYLGQDGVPNRQFLQLLFLNMELSFQFLHETGLLREQMQCPKCQKDMKLIKTILYVDDLRWYCGPVRGKGSCRTQRSIRGNSWFANSTLPFSDIVLLTYELVHNTSHVEILREYNISKPITVEWQKFYQAVLIEYIEKKSEKVGGPNLIVEVDESKYGEKRFYKGNNGITPWRFGGVERDTGKCFLVTMVDRSQETLRDLLLEWVKPGTTILTDSWDAYDRLGRKYYGDIHYHSIQFKKDYGANENESTWKREKQKIPLSLQDNHFFAGYMAEYIFQKECRANNQDRMIKFWEIVRERRDNN